MSKYNWKIRAFAQAVSFNNWMSQIKCSSQTHMNLFQHSCKHIFISQVVLVVKNPLINAGDTRDIGLIPVWGRSFGEGNGNPFQYSCLEDCMGRGTWQAIVHGGAKNRKRLSDWTYCPCYLKINTIKSIYFEPFLYI